MIRPDLGHELLRLQRELASGEYVPGSCRLFTVYERKPRLIACAPFRDRVVHHAVMNLTEPPLDRTFIHDSYACRAGKGTHAAVDRYQGWARRFGHALKMDVSRYFPSIDRDLLKHKLRRRIRTDRCFGCSTMSPFPGLAGRGAPNSGAKAGKGRGW